MAWAVRESRGCPSGVVSRKIGGEPASYSALRVRGAYLSLNAMAHSTPPNPDEPSRALLRAVQEGLPAEVDRWFRAEHTPVFRLCLGFLADEAEAEDAAQDAMLHLQDRLATYDPTRPYRAWRNTVVLNLCRSRRRRIEARRRAENTAAAHRHEVPLPDPAQELERREVREVLRESLSALKPREREAFVLRDLEGLASAEVAQAMGIADSTVRSLLTLARRRLRGILGERLHPAAGEEGVHG